MAPKRKLYQSYDARSVLIPTARQDNKLFDDVDGQLMNMISGQALTLPTKPFIMYHREASVDLEDEIKSFIVSRDGLLVVDGPFGVGISLTSVTTIIKQFSSTTSSSLSVLYVYIPTHADIYDVIQGFLITYNDGVSVFVKKVEFELRVIRNCIAANKVDLVVMDNIKHDTYGRVANLQQFGDIDNFKIIAIASMPVRVSTNLSSISECTVRDGWSLSEYQTALSYDPFYTLVCDNLRTCEHQVINSTNTIAERNKIAAYKFSLAGHCARWFFMETSQVLETIAANIDQINTSMRVYRSSSINDAENQLLSCVNGAVVLVSCFVARKVQLRRIFDDSACFTQFGTMVDTNS